MELSFTSVSNYLNYVRLYFQTNRALENTKHTFFTSLKPQPPKYYYFWTFLAQTVPPARGESQSDLQRTPAGVGRGPGHQQHHQHRPHLPQVDQQQAGVGQGQVS